MRSAFGNRNGMMTFHHYFVWKSSLQPFSVSVCLCMRRAIVPREIQILISVNGNSCRVRVTPKDNVLTQYVADSKPLIAIVIRLVVFLFVNFKYHPQIPIAPCDSRSAFFYSERWRNVIIPFLLPNAERNLCFIWQTWNLQHWRVKWIGLTIGFFSRNTAFVYKYPPML